MFPKETRQSTTEQLRAVNRDERIVSIVFSTNDIDSYGTRIDQDGWDFSAFIKNPVICLQHDDRGYTDTNGLPIAKGIVETISVSNQRGVMDIRFPQKGKFPIADQVFELVADGFMRGVSVGFEPSEWKDVEEEEDGDRKSVRIYTKQRLLEVSLVTIPSNDNALVQRAAKLDADPNIVRKMTEQLEEELDHQTTAEDIAKWRSYFEQKQPINKKASTVLKKFFERVLKEDPPADEKEAWERMSEAVEAMEEAEPVEPVVEEVTEVIQEQPEVPVPEVPEPPVEAPQDERKASVQIPISVLMEFPAKLRQSYVDAGVEALRRGIPVKDALTLIDGMNTAVSTSIPHK